MKSLKKLIVFIVFLGFFVCCADRNEPVDDYRIEHPLKVIGRYSYEPSFHIIELELDGHNYYVFYSKIANPPTVIHSESCPCHNK